MKPEEFTEQVLAFLGTMGVKDVMKPKFYVDVNFNSAGTPSMAYWSDKETVFRFTLGATEWELTVSDPKRESRVTYYADHPTWIAADRLDLFKKKRRVDELPALLRTAEKKLAVTFPRVAYVRTNIAGAKKTIAEWVKTL